MQFSRLCSFIFLSFTAVSLLACGGSGGNKSRAEAATAHAEASAGTSSNASSSMAASSAGLTSCTSAKGDVFINSVCPGWKEVSIYEQPLADPSSYREIQDGSAGDLVTQKIIDSGTPGHDQVLDIQYNGNSFQYGGVVRMFNLESDPEGVDMSEYATGKLVFDVRVISRGDQNSNLEVIIECGWPCNSHEHVIAVSQLNQWQSFEISVKDLIAEGLDIKHVRTGFFIQASWGRQANAHFQVDNVRWIKGVAEPLVNASCFANHLGFNKWDGGKNSYFFRNELLEGKGDMSNWVERITPAVLVRPHWDLVSGTWGVAISEPLVVATWEPVQSPALNDCITGGTFSARVYLPASYVTDGKMKVGLYIGDMWGINQKFDSPVSAADMKADDWTTLTVKLNDYPRFWGTATHTGVYFEANGISPAITDAIQIDNFVITRETVQP